MHDIVYIFYLKQKALQFVCRQTDNRAKVCGQAMTIQPQNCAFRKRMLRPCFTSLDFRASVQKLEKLKKNQNSKRNPYTSCFQEWTLCVKQQTKKDEKRRKKKKRKNFLFLVRTKEGYLTDFFQFVILIVLMTPKIPKISFSVRSAFCLCSFIILTLLSDVWYVWPQPDTPKK